MNMNCKFLIVDDNKIDQLVTRQLFKTKLGITEINQVAHGLEALEWLKENSDNLNDCLIILLDIKMPEMDGFEFLDAFEKLDESLKRITNIIMVSSTLDPSDIERAEKHPHVKKLFTKPLPVAELRNYLSLLN
jgi:CheY-like chemotaxis protein